MSRSVARLSTVMWLTGLIVGTAQLMAQHEATPADIAQGERLFLGNCATCHGADGDAVFGVDLAHNEFRQASTASELERSLIDPGAEIYPQNRSVRVVTADGATVTGRLLNHDTFTVQLIDSGEKLRSFTLASLREFGFVRQSPMPSYKGKLTPDEVRDLVKYLVTLRPSKAKP